MTKFYGVLRGNTWGNTWGITETKPTSESFVLISASTRQAAESKLASLVFQYRPELYL
jgi:hypothetical protein